MLVNNKTPWRRDGSGMPKGKGTLSGVIVHDLQPRYGYTNEGYIGRYSVRVLEKEEIDLAASGIELQPPDARGVELEQRRGQDQRRRNDRPG